ncbi:hypothetical protein SLEP1_g4212 [Rubroshorea leprosula]|uniref:ATP synthase F0 subunit 8 n=1 Tax=Rubroshorea leprosula TaxID=152421 RepID=A0AAV5HWT9_9ROSI|nr:hypothetical protein SLEP1_g4212 [Rubroshorea leprosula]
MIQGFWTIFLPILLVILYKGVSKLKRKNRPYEPLAKSSKSSRISENSGLKDGSLCQHLSSNSTNLG